eukprot:1155618-Pelagomonas_calceolata.AAC.2
MSAVLLGAAAAASARGAASLHWRSQWVVKQQCRCPRQHLCKLAPTTMKAAAAATAVVQCMHWRRD